MDLPRGPSSSSISMRLEPTLTSTMQLTVQMTEAQSALITPPPELRLRSPIPEPQNNGDCGEASRSASEAIRQANQSASQSIQQATQQASQSIQQASRDASQAAQQASQSASQAIQQFSNQASQSIAAASRSVSSAIQSADQAIASAKSSADAAVGRANGSMMTAQANASSAQVRLRMEGRETRFKKNVSNVCVITGRCFQSSFTGWSCCCSRNRYVIACLRLESKTTFGG